MSTNITKFMHGPVWDWVSVNAQLDELVEPIEKKNFWIVPSALGGDEARATEKALLERFLNTKVVFQKEIDQYCFRLIVDGGSRYLLIAKVDGESINFIEDDLFEFEVEHPTFLQQIDFIANFKIPSPVGIPGRLVVDALSKRESIFEEDLKVYFPQIVSWKISSSNPHFEDDFAVICVRAIVILTDLKSPIRGFAGLIVQLALVIPREHHDWLFDQLYFSIANRRLEYFFLGLYRMLEFFFPLKGVAALKSKIGYGGTFLELRAFCSETLGWNINHHTGARAAAFLVSEAFANICFGRTLQNSTPDAIDKHKLDAIAKISELRHMLAHQNFSDIKPDQKDLMTKTEALLTLLTEAFAAYKRHC